MSQESAHPDPEEDHKRGDHGHRRHGAAHHAPPAGRAPGPSPLLAAGAGVLGLAALAGLTLWLDAPRRAAPPPAPPAVEAAPLQAPGPLAAPAGPAAQEPPRSSLDMVRGEPAPEPAPGPDLLKDFSTRGQAAPPPASAPAPAPAPAPKAFRPPRLQSGVTPGGSSVRSWVGGGEDEERATTSAQYTAQEVPTRAAPPSSQAPAAQRARTPAAAPRAPREARSRGAVGHMGQGMEVQHAGTSYQPPAQAAARTAVRGARSYRIHSCKEGLGPVPGVSLCCSLGAWYSAAARTCVSTSQACETAGGGCQQVTQAEIWEDLGPAEASCAVGQARLDGAGICCPADTWTFSRATRCHATQASCAADSGGLHCVQVSVRR